MTIRALVPADEPGYRAFLEAGVAAHPDSFRLSADDVRAMPAPFAPDAHPGPDDVTLGAFAEDSGVLLGVVSLAREKQTKLRHKALLFRMYVSAHSAGQGLGRALLRAALARARQVPVLRQVNLTVVATNIRAKRLYESESFARFAHEPNSLLLDSGFVAEEQMALDLTRLG